MKAKLQTCKECKTEFVQVNSFQKCSDWRCTLSQAQAKRHKKEKKEFDKETRRMKEAAKTKSDHTKDTQKAFNAYIRKIDEGNLCISCQKPPRKKNAGHYLSVGSHPELRFELLNCHLQCEFCNTFKSGNQVNYRINLIKKIGVKKVEWLEGKHGPKKYTIKQLKVLTKQYREMVKTATKRKAA